MRQVIKLFTILAITVMVSSCMMDEDEVCYRFKVFNVTDTEMKIHLSSWGNYAMIINDKGSSDHKFHGVETINPHSSLEFVKTVGGDPNPWVIPSSLTPAWEYIIKIECDGVTIPKEYVSNQENWDLGVVAQFNGTATQIQLYILPELIEQYGKTN
ncbi:MAG: hypothetical protein LIO93_12090 [Bacteroidales bacterium]|nr:hypothetical protein [Bacteroidales bacterium]